MKRAHLPFLTVMLVTLLTAGDMYSQRVKYTINDAWKFTLSEEEHSKPDRDYTAWETVSVPHTWNAFDAADKAPGYHRGKGWYHKEVYIAEPTDGRSFYAYFEGANQLTELFVNGQLAGRHAGGYSAFCFDVTPWLHQGANLFAISVDNAHNEDIPPLSADFTFFGGIYRDVYIISTPQVHVSTTHYASGGVYLTTPAISDRKAAAEIRTLLDNDGSKNATVVLEHLIISPSGERKALSQKIRLAPGAKHFEAVSKITIPDPLLWDTQSPNLYRVHTSVRDSKGNLLDEVVSPLGIRNFSFHPDEGFALNGSRLKLIGTNRHQDYLNMGNALPDQMHVRDVRLLKDMGGNFLRIAHYPQDPVVTEMCDKLGILTTVEIAVVNYITMNEAFTENCLEAAREMIYQNFNSPSVVIWAYMNEIMLRPPYDPSDEAAKKEYMNYLYGTASAIENEIRRLDPSRYTMLPCHGNPAIYRESRISELPHILGWNLYNGWYSGDFKGFEKTLDHLHEMFPDQSLIVTEYGADVDPRIHSFAPEKFDFSAEYGALYHEHYIRRIMERDFIAGSNVWNLNDFHSEGRRDARPTINNKGITGLDRERKDTYFLYKAVLNPDPMVHISGRNWKSRGGVAGPEGTCIQPVTLYTNMPEVAVTMNGKPLGTFAAADNAVKTTIPFRNGENTLEAHAIREGKIVASDLYRCNFQMTPGAIGSEEGVFTELNVMLGSSRYFEERESELVWIPEKEYTPGSWGYTGGRKRRFATRHGSHPASDLAIFGTANDPVFQTQREEIESFRADVPDGRYSVYLYLAELTPAGEREVLAYNLGNDAVEEAAGERIFNVYANGKMMLRGLDIEKEAGKQRAIIKKFEISIENGRGLDITFQPVKGKTVLNAIRIYRNY